MLTPHHFAGTLTTASAEPLHGIHQITVGLVDDDGAHHIAYMVFGRGDLAAAACQRTFETMAIGQRYHGSATLQRAGTAHTMHFGRVVLAADRRRARYEPAPAGRAAA